MSSLSSSDQDTLRTIGENTIQSIVALCVKSALWAIYLVLIVMCMRILLRKRYGRSAPFYVIFVVVFVMFLMDTAMFFIDINDTIKVVSYTLTSNANLSLQDRLLLTYTLPYPVQSAMYAFMSNLGDIIVIWRVLAFYPRGSGRWILAFPIALLASSFVTSGLISFCVAKFAPEEAAAGDIVHPAFCRNIQLTSYCTTLVTTGFATLMISYKTWVYRRDIGRHVHESLNNAVRIERIATILIESGVLYFLFHLQAVISDSGAIPALEHSTVGLTFAGTIWTYNMSHVMAIYPAIVVILVHSERSYIDNATMESMNFAPGGSRSGQLTTVGPTWTVSQTATTGQGTQPIEINVHELRTAPSFSEPGKSRVKAGGSTEDVPGDIERGKEYGQ
ncbi:hypothetical protein PHLGIDRAFT_309382 [Phlebiopsis gigantea 11061_1 CR5-6]|uniref:G-protein coupled receptors family 1 profile domain-containing protein n=1 Tax=Phlebiopsis gigantea (strain 11061_1 CR5-6) TaxID=745531 RepID=A0A0C3NC91_PHLG1|nr:hypothetical protein PHLGIDRAFT_309382 [Phlebiopsis gigantea 11061_1 CR5-6]